MPYKKYLPPEESPTASEAVMFGLCVCFMIAWEIIKGLVILAIQAADTAAYLIYSHRQEIIGATRLGAIAVWDLVRALYSQICHAEAPQANITAAA